MATTDQAGTTPADGDPDPETATARPRVGHEMRGRRYGEVLLVKGGLPRPTATVYTTIGLNECPQDLWASLDAQEIRRTHHALAVILNGPRHFVLDEIQSADLADAVVTFGGLQMRRAATLPVPVGLIGGLGGGPRPYVERVVNRTTRYVFRAGRAVYELVGPGGATYVMQSYARTVNPAQTEPSLPALGARLKLPPGWTYRSRIPDADLVVETAGQARMVQDDQQNSYQRV